MAYAATGKRVLINNAAIPKRHPVAALDPDEVEGERKHAIAHYLDLAAAGRADLRPTLTHTFGLEQWREAFLTIANQADSGAVEVAFDQREAGRVAR
jgi:hypothetical protein